MADIHQPHDRLFRAVFSDPAEAASLIRKALPDTIRRRLNWTTLTLTDGTFIDEELRESQVDLLYEVEDTDTGEPTSVYVLLEHQSTPDPLMRLRLLRYCCRIWETDFRNNPDRHGWRLIVPVVFYQGTRGWRYSTEFSAEFLEAHRTLPWVPKFAHVLLDQTNLAPEAVTGSVRARIAQLLLMAASGHQPDTSLRLVTDLASLPEAGGEGNLGLFISYLAKTQDRERLDTFKQTMHNRGIDIGGELMTYAEELLAEGRAEGEQRGEQRAKVKIVEGLLQADVAWNIIEAATGLTETTFQELKAQLASTDPEADGKDLT